MLKAGAEGRVVNTVVMEEESFATPASAGSSLYVRTRQGIIYCFRNAD